MRAATALLSLLKDAGTPMPAPALWRAHDLGTDAGTAAIASGHAALDAELPGGGWPCGQLIELLPAAPGVGELSLLLPALARLSRAGRSVVWVLPCAADARALAQSTQPYAPALADSGIDCARHIVVQPATARESWWALEQSLRAAHLGAVIGWLPAGASTDGDFKALRRLQLLASTTQALAFVLRPAACAQAPSPAALRLALRGGDTLQVQLLKRRGRPLLDPVAVAVHPAHWQAAPQASTPRPAAAPQPHARAVAAANDASAAEPIAAEPIAAGPLAAAAAAAARAALETAAAARRGAAYGLLSH